MKINVNRRILKAGQVIEVTWEAEGAVSPRLVIHTGKRESILAVPSSGTKRFRMKTPGMSQWIGLKVWDGNEERLLKHRLVVWGRPAESDAFEYMDHHDSWWKRTREAVKRWWNLFTPEKKRLYVLLLLLIVYQTILGLGYLYGAHLMLTAIIFYLFWQIIKRN